MVVIENEKKMIQCVNQNRLLYVQAVSHNIEVAGSVVDDGIAQAQKFQLNQYSKLANTLILKVSGSVFSLIRRICAVCGNYS